MITINEKFLNCVTEDEHSELAQRLQVFVNEAISTNSPNLKLSSYDFIEIIDPQTKEYLSLMPGYKDQSYVLASWNEGGELGIGYCGSCASYTKCVNTINSFIRSIEKSRQITLF